MSGYKCVPLSKNVEEMFIGPFGSSLKNECFVNEDEAYCMVYEQKHAIQKTMNVETRYVNEQKYKELKRFNIQAGDIIVSCRGTIGETYIVPNDAPLGIMHPSIMKIRLKKDVYDKYYFNLLLKSRLKKHEAEANGSGVKMAISATELGKELFPVPTMDEQLEITDIISKISTVIEKRQEELRQLDNLIKARFVEMFEGKFPLIKLGEVIKTTSGGTPSKAHKEYYENGTIPWLTSGEINAGVITTVKNFITDEGLNNSSAKIVPKNSVVIAMYGATAGVTGILRLETTTNQAVCSLLPSERFIPEFLYYAVSAKKNWMISQCQGGGQPNISQGIIKSMYLIDAPKDEQIKFSDFAKQIDKSKVAVQKALDEAQLLFDSLMQEYFG